jgi:hypothetical protein
MGGLEQKIHEALLSKDYVLASELMREFEDTKLEVNHLTGPYEFLEQICHGYLEAVSSEVEKLLELEV